MDIELTLEETIDELRRLVNHLDVMTRQAAEDDLESLDQAVELLVALNSVKSNLNTAYAGYEQTIAKEMEDTYALNLPGGVKVTRREGAPRRKWDHQRLSKDVAERIVEKSVDMETGEILKTNEEIVVELMRYGHIDYWRIKELSGLGLDARQYSEMGDPKVSVVIERKQY